MSIEAVFSSGLVVNGVTVAGDGRLFLPVQPGGPGRTPQIVEVRDGSWSAYPDDRWNGWLPGMDAADRFVGVNAIRIGPDGFLWAVDRGASGIGKAVEPRGAKLVRIDLATDRVDRIYDLGAATAPWSFVDDVRFHGTSAYLTDAGRPGLIVLDLESGETRRVLEGHPSTIAQTPLVAEGVPLLDERGDPVNIHADQLEISPDGRWFYYQPSSGRMSRIETRFLDDPTLPEAELGAMVERFADTPSTGGTAIDADGTIYLSDVEESRILAISADGEVRTLVQDPRLAWVDAMWIDDTGGLLMPAAQLNRTPGVNRGSDTTELPITLYRLQLGIGPVRR